MQNRPYTTEAEKIPFSGPKYSVCTLVTDNQEYELMLDSFLQAGFNAANTEFIFVDNTNSNKYDAYTALNHFIFISKGEYIIICHQDILLLNDDEKKLNRCINELNEKFPRWGVAGNSGGIGIKNHAFHITEADEKFNNKGPFPARVHTLDENFMILRRKANPGFSCDLGGFHFYGTDICLQMESRGYEAYVIEFRLKHKGSGTTDKEFYKCKNILIKKFEKVWRGRYIQTPCTKMYMSGSGIMNKLLNMPPAMFVAKEVYKRILNR